MDREKQARTVDIEVDFIDPGNTVNLLPGYSADVEIMLNARDNVLRIPTEALLENKRVLVYNATDGILQERKVTTGLTNWVYTEITNGLQQGEHVVTSVDRKGVEAGVEAITENTLSSDLSSTTSSKTE
jgi:HlyD family secretion protein